MTGEVGPETEAYTFRELVREPTSEQRTITMSAEEIERLTGCLTDQEKDILRRRFNVTSKEGPSSLEQIASDTDTLLPSVRIIEARAIA